MLRVAALALVLLVALSESKPQRFVSKAKLRSLLASRAPGGSGPGGMGPGGSGPGGSGSGSAYPPPPPPPPSGSGSGSEDFSGSGGSGDYNYDSYWYGQIVCRMIDCGGMYWYSGDYDYPETMWAGWETPDSMWSGYGSAETPDSMWSGYGSAETPPESMFSGSGSGSGYKMSTREESEESGSGFTSTEVEDYIEEQGYTDTDIAWWMGYCAALETLGQADSDEYANMACEWAYIFYPEEKAHKDKLEKLHKMKKIHAKAQKKTLKEETVAQLMKLMKIKAKKMH